MFPMHMLFQGILPDCLEVTFLTCRKNSLSPLSSMSPQCSKFYFYSFLTLYIYQSCPLKLDLYLLLSNSNLLKCSSEFLFLTLHPYGFLCVQWFLWHTLPWINNLFEHTITQTHGLCFCEFLNLFHYRTLYHTMCNGKM